MPLVSARAAPRLVPQLKRFHTTPAAAKARDINDSDTVLLATDILVDLFGYNKYTEITIVAAIGKLQFGLMGFMLAEEHRGLQSNPDRATLSIFQRAKDRLWGRFDTLLNNCLCAGVQINLHPFNPQSSPFRASVSSASV